MRFWSMFSLQGARLDPTMCHGWKYSKNLHFTLDLSTSQASKASLGNRKMPATLKTWERRARGGGAYASCRGQPQSRSQVFQRRQSIWFAKIALRNQNFWDELEGEPALVTVVACSESQTLTELECMRTIKWKQGVSGSGFWFVSERRAFCHRWQNTCRRSEQDNLVLRFSHLTVPWTRLGTRWPQPWWT